AGVPAARRQASRPHPALRDDRGANGPEAHRRRAGAHGERLERHPDVDPRTIRGRRRDAVRAARIHRRDRHGAHAAARSRPAGPPVVLGIAYHHRLSVAEAASFCQRMPPGTLDFLEEPIRDETPDAYASLRSMVDVPFAIGEEFQSKWQFLPYIERGLTQFAR